MRSFFFADIHGYMNMGSVSLPKNGNSKSYMIYEGGNFTVKLLESGEAQMGYSVKNP